MSWIHSADRDSGGVLATISDDCRCCTPCPLAARRAVHTSRLSVALWSLPSPQVPGAGDAQDGGLTDLQPLCRHGMAVDEVSLLVLPLDLTALQVARG